MHLIKTGCCALQLSFEKLQLKSLLYFKQYRFFFPQTMI